MKRHAGRLLVLVGIVHTLVGIAVAPGPLVEIAGTGLLNAVDPDVGRQVVFWFHATGALLILLGTLAQWTQERLAAVPPFLGWGLAAFSAVGIVLMPVSGFWLVLAVAALLLRAARAPAAAAVQPAGEAGR